MVLKNIIGILVAEVCLKCLGSAPDEYVVFRNLRTTYRSELLFDQKQQKGSGFQRDYVSYTPTDSWKERMLPNKSLMLLFLARLALCSPPSHKYTILQMYMRNIHVYLFKRVIKIIIKKII